MLNVRAGRDRAMAFPGRIMSGFSSVIGKSSMRCLVGQTDIRHILLDSVSLLLIKTICVTY